VTSTELALDGSEARTAPDPTSRAVGGEDPEGDGTQDLADTRRDLARADINGDGLTDRENTLATGVGTFASQGGQPIASNIRRQNLRVMDYDGDGRSDFLVVQKRASSKMAVMRWMNGSWSEIPLDIDVGHEASGPQAATAQFECKSAPGLGALITDSAACADHPDRNYCRWTNSPHFEDSAQVFFGRDGAGNPNQFVLQKAFVWGCTPTGLVFSGTTTPEPEYRTTQVLDWNGDGLMDIITVDTSGHLKVYKRKGKKADLLVRVQDGFFANTQVTYAPMSDAATYTPGSASDCKYPLRCLRSGNWLVSTSSVDTGVNGEDAVSSYKYTDARSDMRGRGWLGMQKQETTREVDFTNPAPEGTTKFTEKRVTEFGHAFTLDRDAFPLAQFVTRVRSSTIGTTAGLTSGTEQAMTPEIFRGTAGVDPGSPPVPPYILVGSTSDPSLTPSVNVLDHQKNTLVYFVNTARTTTREFQNDLTDPFPGEEKRKTVVERERDLYGNVTKERTFVWARAKKGAPLPPDAEWLSRTENESTFEGNASAFKESRFLGLAQRLISNHSLRPKTGPVVAALPRIVEQTFTASRATIDSTKTQPDAPDGSDEKLLTSTDRLSLYGLPEVVSMTGSGKTRTTQTRYDGVEHMYAEETIDPEGHTTRLRTIPGIDRVAWSQDANGIITRMQYDGFGRPRTVDGPASADVTITYDFAATGNLRITTTKTSGERTVVEHDELVRPISVERRLFASGTSSIETTEYDPLGRVRRVTGPYGEKIVRFDRIGRVIEEHRPDEAMGAGLHLVTETHYDDYFTARVVTQAGRVGQVLTREQSVVTDALGQMTDKTEKVDGHTVTTSYEYKPFGLIAKVSHGPTGAQSTTTMDYDVLGRRKTLETPDTGKTTTLYNAFGEPREETDADGNVMTLDHDGLGRVVKRTDKKGTAVSEATFVFDRAANGVGQLGEATQGSPDNVKTVLSYEPVFGAVSSSDLSVPDGSVTRTYSTLQSYDSFGRADTVSYPETPGRPRFTVRNVYGGANGLLSEIRDITGGADNLLWKADEREPLGRIQQERLGNGVISTRGYAPETGRLTSINAGAGMVQNLSYKYYADGTVFLRHDVKSGLRERFEYDGVGRLDGWMKATANDDADPQGWSVAWTYDDRGNLTKRVVTGTTAVQTINQGYNGGAAAPHRLDTSDLWPAQTFGYDLLGNVKSHPGVGTIDYTAFNLPRKVTSSSFTKNYLYDAFGTRVRNGTGGDSITYVGGLYERRTDGNDVIHIHYVRADGRLVTQVSRNELAGTDESTYVYSDHLGSTQVVQSASGALTERRQDPFGNPLAWNGTTLDPRIGAAAPGAGTVHDVTKGFTGAEEEGDLGVVNMGGRIYDPRLGRFLQADPLVSAPTMSQGWNRYAYGLDNPMRFIDPTGFVTAQTVEEDARAHELSVPDYCAIYQVQCAQQRMGSDNPQLVYQGIAEEGAADHVAWLHQAVEGQRGWEAEQQRAKVSNREMAQEYLDRAKDPRSTKVVPAEELVLAAAQIVGSGLQKTANVKGFVYNPDEAAAAHWDKKTGYIVIGKQAFTHGVGDLQSTIRHELVHAKQDQMGYAGGDRTRQRAYNEIEAYYTQLAHARADGTSEQMQKDVQSMIGLYQKFLDGLVTWDGVPIK
jgi:RHS repeat-associated protein